MVREAAEKVLMDHSTAVAEALLECIKGGNANCAKFLFALAEGRVAMEDAGPLERLQTIAEELASQPPWQDEVDQEDCEASFEEGESENRCSISMTA